MTPNTAAEALTGPSSGLSAAICRSLLPFGWPDFGPPWSPLAWTLVGASAVPLWATWPALTVGAAALPPFQLLTVAFLVGWLVLTGVDRLGRGQVARDRAAGWRSRLLPAAACALGLSGTNAFFIMAADRIPPAQANLISFLWPVMIVAIGAAAGYFAVGLRHVGGLLTGFVGAGLVIGVGAVAPDWPGIGLAFLSGLSWALFCLFRLRQGGTARNVLADGCALSVPFCLVLHLALEATVRPAPGALLAAVAIGIAPLALANLAWDTGIRRGDARLLATMAYATPLLSTILLIGLGLAVPSLGLILGGVLIVTAGAMAALRVR